MNVPKAIDTSWYPLVADLFEGQEIKDTVQKLSLRPYAPEAPNIFRGFSIPMDRVKVVIMGLSPYYYKQNGQFTATGIAMGVPDKSFDTPTLEIIRDAIAVQCNNPVVEETFDYTLQSWVDQGVMLINRALTVDLKSQSNPKPDPAGHFRYWDWFMKQFIERFSTSKQGVIYAFLGADAAEMAKYVDLLQCPYVFKTCHPAATARVKHEKTIPEALNFMKQNLFVNINTVLEQTGQEIIDWSNSNPK